MKEWNIANFQKQPFAFVLSIRCSLKEVKFFKIDRKAPVLEPIFDTADGLSSDTLL